MKFSIGSMYSTHSQTSLKSLLKSINNGYPVDADITSDFPGFVGFRASIESTISDNISAGGFGAFNSTGGRSTYSDYSGKLTLDMITQVFSFGAVLSSKFLTFKKVTVIGKVSLAVDFSKLLIKSELILDNNQVDNVEYSFNATGLSIWPSLKGKYKVTKTFRIYIEPGVQISVKPGSFKMAGGTLINGEKEVKAEWNGLRLEAGFVFLINTTTY